jgi:hypothetical protein
VLGTAAIGLVYLAFGVYRLATGHLTVAGDDAMRTEARVNHRNAAPR